MSDLEHDTEAVWTTLSRSTVQVALTVKYDCGCWIRSVVSSKTVQNTINPFAITLWR
jgi:hypothetical protein